MSEWIKQNNLETKKNFQNFQKQKIKKKKPFESIQYTHTT